MANADKVEEGKAKAAGIVSILIGICAFIELICGLMWLAKGGPEGSGLWSGVGLAVIAALGIVTWLKRNKIVMVFYLVMCILWFIVCIVQVIIAFVAWLIWHVIWKVVETNCEQIGEKCVCLDTGENVPITVHRCDEISAIKNIFLCILIMSAIAAILTLAGSIIGCMGTCCAKNQNQGNVVVVHRTAEYPMAAMVVQQTTVTHQASPAQAYPVQQPYLALQQPHPTKEQGHSTRQQANPPGQEPYPEKLSFKQKMAAAKNPTKKQGHPAGQQANPPGQEPHPEKLSFKQKMAAFKIPTKKPGYPTAQQANPSGQEQYPEELSFKQKMAAFENQSK